MMTAHAQPTAGPAERPAWMRRADQRTDGVLLLVIAIGLLSALGFAAMPALPATGGLERYAFRIENDAQALLEGRLYPRWTANTFGGYGAPIPSFSPPLPSFGPAVLHAMLVADAADALRLFAAIVLLGGSLSAYLWVRDQAGRRAGLLAAVLSATSPWLAFSLPYVLGSIDLMLIAALAPAWWWLAGRMNTRSTWLLACAVAALLLLSEPRLAVLAFALTPALLPIRSRWLHIALAALAGAGVSAFSWLPAILEAGLVRWITPEAPLYALLTPSTILRAAGVWGPLWANPQPQPALGLPLLAALALVCVSALQRRALPFSLRALLAGGGLLAGGLFIPGAPEAQGVYSLAVVALCAAGGGAALALPHRRNERWYAAALALALLLNAPVWLTLPMPAQVSAYSASAEVEYEQRGFGIAVVPPGHPAVSVLAETTLPDQTLVAGFRTGEVFKTSTQSGDATVGVLQHSTHRDRFQVNALSPFELRILTAAFDGWTARFNGQPLPIRADTDGLIRLTVPAGNGELELQLEATPVRAAAWAITGLALAGCLFIMRRLRLSEPAAEASAHPVAERWRLTTAGFVLAAGATAAVILASRAGLMMPGNMLPEGWLALDAAVQPGVDLAGMQPFSARVSAGDTITLRTAWRAPLADAENISIRLVLLQADSAIAAASASAAPGSFSSARWPAGQPVLDQRTLHLPDSLAPGSYRIAVEAFLCSPRCDEQPLTWTTTGTLTEPRFILPGALSVSQAP